MTQPAAAEKAAPPPPGPHPSNPPPPSPSPAAAAAKPEKPAPAPAARAPVAPPAAPAPAKAAAPVAPPPAPAVSNSQDDIDALLNGLDEATTPEEIRPAAPEPEPEADVLDLTDEMALPDPAPQAAFRKIEPPDDLEFTETAGKAPPRD